jgi:predicted unusual protein kinase regulating ubiquinone biosynthesis (AarF/ABC1/UbiB family)
MFKSGNPIPWIVFGFHSDFSPPHANSNSKVIVSDWIDGDKLADSKTSDIKALCSTLLNCYLIQLLETGLLHADPHPG